jgi:hypothetical protein
MKQAIRTSMLFVSCLINSLCAAEVQYAVAEKPWNAALGNHRAVLRVEKSADAIQVHLPWRRRDIDVTNKAVIVTDAAGKVITNALPARFDRESGDIVFQAGESGEYYAYYMPFTIRGGAFPTTIYTKPEPKADTAWLSRNGLGAAELPAGKWTTLPKAELLRFESRTEFDSFYPMEVVATAAEVAQLLSGNPRPYLLFPEDRRFPIRMTADLPERWVRSGPQGEFRGDAMRNEFYAFQVGVYAAAADLKSLSVEFSDLKCRGSRKVIPSNALRCFNVAGRDWLGRSISKQVDVPKGNVQALWFGVDVPESVYPGQYEGTVTIRPAGLEPSNIRLLLTVLPEVCKDRGDADLWRMSRLRWLDSTIGLDDTVTAPYTPLKVKGNSVSCLGRDVTFNEVCLPDCILCGLNNILAAPVTFSVETSEGKVDWKARKPKVVDRNPARVTVESSAKGGFLSLGSHTEMEFDGYINFRLSLNAEKDVELRDCYLEIPLKKDFAAYMMGMGCKGGYRPEKWDWKWDQKKHQDSVWVGNVTGGLQCKLKGPDYRWPLVNIHYHNRPLIMPEAWFNEGKGGCRVEPAGNDRVVIRAYGGPRKVSAGQELRFDFALLVTPVKPLDAKPHWQQRYYHSGGVSDPAEVAKTGAKIVNIHQGNNGINPFINYPFLTVDKMSDYVKRAHDAGLKTKIYYTIRELSNHVAELWAMRSLGGEIYAEGRGGGYAWLHEHLLDRYSSAWHENLGYTWDAAISQTGLSRWHNYYLEGLNWLCMNIGIDGLYLDEIGYDREIMKRVRRVLDKARPDSLLDLHSWNHLNGMAGYANCLNLYMEHMPYLDSLWIGEGRNYDEGPDHYMVEISGIPFGLYSEMLHGGGNQWRGMIYGMTSRLPWSGNPKPIWKIWNEFGIEESRMIGYWEGSCPVKTDNKDVLATAYVKKDRVLISIASWADKPAETALSIDWKALGFDPANVAITAPQVEHFQSSRTFKVGEKIPVEPKKGWLLILERTTGT